MMSTAAGLAASTRAALLSTAAAFAFALPGTAYAQNAAEAQPVEEAQPAGDMPSEDVANGNEIVVTATKREQTLQDVPVAVTVTTAQTIERAHIRDIRDLSNLVPSLRVGERQNSANTNFFIRGFGNGANNAGIEPSVGVFIDGVYRSRSAAQISDLPDVDRIEVLRGPQSTLFGKNASAGVISIVTAKPKFEFGGNIEASYGNFDAKVIKGVITGPISDTVALSLAGGLNKRDGWAHNVVTGTDTNDRNRWFVRGQALFESANGLRVRLIGDYGKIDEICCAVVNVLTGARTGVLTSPPINGQVNVPADAFADRIYTNFDSTNHIKNYGVSGQIDYEVGPLKLTSITAWRRSLTDANFDSDYTSADLLRGSNLGHVDLKTFTQELRATASIANTVDVLVGGFYFNEKVNQGTHLAWGANARTYADVLIRGLSSNAFSVGGLESLFGLLNNQSYAGKFFAAGPTLDEIYNMKNENYSLFSQVDFHVSDRLTLTGGIAYTNDKKRYSTNVQSSDTFSRLDLRDLAIKAGISQTVGGIVGAPGGFATATQIAAFATANPATFSAIQAGATAAAATSPLLGLRQLQFFPDFLNVPNAVEPGRTADHKFTYTARLAYDLTDTVNVYGSYATGYKASSINLSRDSRPFAGQSGGDPGGRSRLPQPDL